LENPSKKTLLEIIEVQSGEYVEEDDIVRFKDDYERG
jgi:mannose-1-phosphate guanylyltransferase/mannose-6-phosphate isomerase